MAVAHSIRWEKREEKDNEGRWKRGVEWREKGEIHDAVLNRSFSSEKRKKKWQKSSHTKEHSESQEF